jgi:FlaA1/EpsC-like NDP-sugar epimerase
MLARNRILLAGDLVATVVAALGAFALRTDLGPLFIYYLPQAFWLVGLALLVKPLVYYLFGLYRRLWAYASTQELKLIVLAVTTASVLLSLIVVLLRALQVLPNFPRSSLPIDWLLSLVLVGGLRFSLRVLADTQITNGEQKGSRNRRVLVVGAGDAGALVVREMQKNPQLRMQPEAFLDDDADKQRQQIHGVPVEGMLTDLARVVNQRRIDEVIIAIPSAPGRVVRQVADVCRSKSVPFRTMPGMYELIGGKVNVNRLRESDYRPAAPGTRPSGRTPDRREPERAAGVGHRGRRLDRAGVVPPGSPLGAFFLDLVGTRRKQYF